MKGDFSRVTFDPDKQYTGVFHQQGRVQLDADWNEQADIQRHFLRSLAADLIGPFGAPAERDGTPGRGFQLVPRRNPNGTPIPGDFTLRPGRYYVDGIAVENRRDRFYSDPDPSPLPRELAPGKRYLLLLDLWERHVTYLLDDLLREVALLGPDTATRSQLAWRVRATEVAAEQTCRAIRRDWHQRVERWQSEQRGRLKARARPGTPDDTDPCLAAPEARYRGENQLYRVEIHHGSDAQGHGATFKWSADNGSVLFPVRDLVADASSKTTTATLEHLGRGEGLGLVQDDWIEVVDGEEDLRDGGEPLLQVSSVDPDRRMVVLKGVPPAGLGTNLMLRRWDHRRGIARKALQPSGTYPVIEGQWLDLEDGVQVFFESPAAGSLHAYRAGDYWVIPARVATGDVEWPGPADTPLPQPPRGVEHHYAPLGLLMIPEGSDPVLVDVTDCRTTFGTRACRLDTGFADWQLVQVPAGFDTQVPRLADIVANPDSTWDSLEGARWISASIRRGGVLHTDPLQFVGGEYTYELKFDLCTCVHHAVLELDLLADNTAQVLLNGKLIVPRHPAAAANFIGYKNPPAHREVTGVEPVTRAPWFVPGENLLRVVVTNNQTPANKGEGPTGFVLRGFVDAGECGCR